jgi:hypothetical protein
LQGTYDYSLFFRPRNLRAFADRGGMIRASRRINAADEIASADDWHEDIAITAAEVDVLEMFLGDMIDAFLRPRHFTRAALPLAFAISNG